MVLGRDLNRSQGVSHGQSLDRSTRPIELAWENGRFSARILACSCAEDYRIALDIVCGVAERTGAQVESEEGVRFEPADRDAHYGREWIDEHVRAMVSTVAGPLGEGVTSVMPGTTRDFHLGPRVRAAVAEAPPERRPDVLFARMRALFYPDEERYYVANTMEVTLEDGRRVSMAVLGPSCAYVLPPVEYLTILDSKPFQIPFAALESVVSERGITWLDDACPQVEAIAPAEWDAFVTRARARAVDIGLDPAEDADDDPRSAPVEHDLDGSYRVALALVIALAIAVIVLVALVR